MSENSGVLECFACIQYMTIEFINFFLHFSFVNNLMHTSMRIKKVQLNCQTLAQKREKKTNKIRAVVLRITIT